MKNKQTKEEFLNEKISPFIQYQCAQTSIQHLAKWITDYSKTQSGEKRKSIESDVECLWYALEFMKYYEGAFKDPVAKTKKAVSDLTMIELFDSEPQYLMTRSVVQHIAEMVVEESIDFPVKQKDIEGYLNVLWTTLEIMHTCKGFFQEPDATQGKLAA